MSKTPNSSLLTLFKYHYLCSACFITYHLEYINNNNELTLALIATQEKMALALAENAAAIKNMPIKSLSSGKETSFSSVDNNKEILDAIRESQDRMTQMIMQHNTMAASNSSNNNTRRK